MPVKYKEPIKTVILCLLLISIFVLVARLWIFEELYNVADTSDIVSILSRRGNGIGPANTLGEEGTQRLGEIFIPLRMVASYGSDRSFVTHENGAFENYYTEIKTRMTEILSKKGAAFTPVNDPDEWQKAISVNSLFLDYTESISLRLLCQNLGISSPMEGDDIEVRYVALHCDEQRRVAQLYLKDAKKQMVYMLETGLDGKIVDVTAKIARDTEQKKGASYLFEEEKALAKGMQLGLGSEQVFFERPIVQPVITVQNPMVFQTESQDLIEKNILNVFLYNASTVKKYTSDSGQVFVENFSTLRIDSDGLVEYHATQTDRGIALFSASQVGAAILSRYDIVQSAYQLLFSLDRQVVGGDGGLIYCGMEYLTDQKCYRLYFNYTYDNYEIWMDYGENNKGYPISIDITEGYVTGAVIFARTFYPEGSYRSQQPRDLVLNTLLYSNQTYPLKGLDERYLYHEGDEILYLQYCTQP